MKFMFGKTLGYKTVIQILIFGSDCVIVFLQSLSGFLMMYVVAVQEGNITCSISQFAKFIWSQEQPLHSLEGRFYWNTVGEILFTDFLHIHTWYGIQRVFTFD